MNIVDQPIRILDQGEECVRLRSLHTLTGESVNELREVVENCARAHYPVVYLDVKQVEEMDLSGINEVIQSHFTLEQASKKLVVIYRRNSSVEKWVNITGLSKFIETAIVA